MAYRNVEAGVKAARAERNDVMSPEPYYYSDYILSDVAVEPHVHDKQYLNRCYEYDPLPDGVDPGRINGGQGNLWTELVYNMRHLQCMV